MCSISLKSRKNVNEVKNILSNLIKKCLHFYLKYNHSMFLFKLQLEVDSTTEGLIQSEPTIQTTNVVVFLKVFPFTDRNEN